MKMFVEKKDRYVFDYELLSKVNPDAKFIQDGNDKLDKSIGNFSITPVLSCRNCSDCKNTCYARAPYEMRDNVKARWDYNFLMAKSAKGRLELKERLTIEIQRFKTKTAIRIHVAGDFFSQEYIDMWTDIVKACPNITFYTYTKVSKLYNFSALKSLPNINIIDSIAADGGKNYGNFKRVSELLCQGYLLCPATIPESEFGKDGKKCGKDCRICMQVGNNKVCFLEH